MSDASQHRREAHDQRLEVAGNCAYFECSTMSDKFESLDANEKAGLESTLYRCRALVGRIGEELRKKKPDHFVDERSLRPSRLP